MAVAHNLGFPRIGADRELKKALEAYWKGELDEQGLRQVGRQLRARHWQAQLDAGIELLPVGDLFAKSFLAASEPKCRNAKDLNDATKELLRYLVDPDR